MKQELESEQEIIIQNFKKNLPILKQDINYLKILLTPLEIYCLKKIIAYMSPFTTRRMYVEAINEIFCNDILPKDSLPEVLTRFYKDISNAYPNLSLLSKKEREAIHTEWATKSKSFPADVYNTKRVDLAISFLKKYKMSFPSQQTMKRTLERLQFLGFLITENKGYERKKKKEFFWRISPLFYEQFKERLIDIQNL